MNLCFPFMHPDLLPPAAGLPAPLLFLDPGLGEPGDGKYLLPGDAPFDRRTARALLKDTLRFGETAGNPRDLAARVLASQAGESAGQGDVLGEVRRALLPDDHGSAAGQKADPLLAARQRGQMLLLLAWNLEERLLDVRGIDASLRDSWNRLTSSVSDPGSAGAADGGGEGLGRRISGMEPLGGTPPVLPWRALLEPFALFAPAGAVLCSPLAEIGEALGDAGVAEAPAEARPGAAHVFRAAVWRLMGLGRRPEGRPWLDAEATLAVFPGRD